MDDFNKIPPRPYAFGVRTGTNKGKGVDLDALRRHYPVAFVTPDSCRYLIIKFNPDAVV